MVQGRVVYASSHDPSFPPTAVLDGQLDTFWVSGGLFPQYLVLSLPSLTALSSLALTTYNVRSLLLERSVKNQPTDFEEVFQTELEHSEGSLQESALLPAPVSAVHLRITIKQGHDHFCSVHRMLLAGQATGGSVPPPVVAAAHGDADLEDRDDSSIVTNHGYQKRSFGQQQQPPIPPPPPPAKVTSSSSGWRNEEEVEDYEEDPDYGAEEEDAQDAVQPIVDEDSDNDIQQLVEEDDYGEQATVVEAVNDDNDEDDSSSNIIRPFNLKVKESPKVQIMQNTSAILEGPAQNWSPPRMRSPVKVKPRREGGATDDDLIYGLPDADDY